MHSEVRAFSLLETLISLAIISLLFVVSFSGFITLTQSAIEEQLLYRLIHVFRFAHQQAVNKHFPVAVCKSRESKHCGGDWQEGQIVFMDSYGDGTIRNQAQLLAVRQSSKVNGYLHSRTFPLYRDYILFTPRGFLANDNGTFWYCRKGKEGVRWAIVLTKSGRIRPVYPDKKGDVFDSHGEKLVC